VNVYVVDASVGIKWFVPEIYSEAARQLLSGSHQLLVPDLFFPEISNILWKRVVRGEDSPADARATLANFQAVPLQVYASQPLMPAALDLALETSRTAYDSLYLTLAIAAQCQLATADLRLFRGLSNSQYANHLCWIEAIAP
jgi:predicted nucleic acid-binding protein